MSVVKKCLVFGSLGVIGLVWLTGPHPHLGPTLKTEAEPVSALQLAARIATNECIRTNGHGHWRPELAAIGPAVTLETFCETSSNIAIAGPRH